jgi:beta-N-acetylhexosaminidase
VRIGPTATRDLLDSVARLADAASTVIVTAYVRRVDGAGRVAVPQPIATWIDALATRRRVIVVAFGNPYLLGQFPNVGSYLAAYAVTDDLERAAASALIGRGPITGRAPISLPGVFKAGDGLRR